MEPFVAEQDQRINHEKPSQSGKGDGGKNNTPILMVLVVALLAMGGALVAIVFAQQRSFDALQQNVQLLQGKLEVPASAPAAVEEVAEVEPEPAPAPEPAPVEATPSAVVESSDIARLTAAIDQLQKQIGQLESRVSQLDRKVASAPVTGGGDTRALTQTTNRLSSDVSTLRKEILDMKLSLNDTDGVSKDWQSGIGQRLNAMEGDILALRQNSRGSVEDVSLADAVHQLQQEMIRLKRQQKRLHPYEKD